MVTYQAASTAEWTRPSASLTRRVRSAARSVVYQKTGMVVTQTTRQDEVERIVSGSSRQSRSSEELLKLARHEDAVHRAAHRKPISADTLRVRLGVGATRARRLVKFVRSEHQPESDSDHRTEGGGWVVQDGERVMA